MSITKEMQDGNELKRQFSWEERIQLHNLGMRIKQCVVCGDEFATGLETREVCEKHLNFIRKR